MRTNIDIDDELAAQAMDLIDIKKEVADYALKELVRLKKRKSILNYKCKLK